MEGKGNKEIKSNLGANIWSVLSKAIMTKGDSWVTENCNNTYSKIYRDNKYPNAESMHWLQKTGSLGPEISCLQDTVFKRNNVLAPN